LAVNPIEAHFGPLRQFAVAIAIAIAIADSHAQTAQCRNG